MVENYKQWDDTKLIQTGLRVKYLVETAKRNQLEVPMDTKMDIFQVQKDTQTIYLGEVLLDKLREEYKKRNAGNY